MGSLTYQRPAYHLLPPAPCSSGSCLCITIENARIGPTPLPPLYSVTFADGVGLWSLGPLFCEPELGSLSSVLPPRSSLASVRMSSQHVQHVVWASCVRGSVLSLREASASGSAWASSTGTESRVYYSHGVSGHLVGSRVQDALLIN